MALLSSLCEPRVGGCGDRVSMPALTECTEVWGHTSNLVRAAHVKRVR